jgi:hypothetical protein
VRAVTTNVGPRIRGLGPFAGAASKTVGQLPAGRRTVTAHTPLTAVPDVSDIPIARPPVVAVTELAELPAVLT